MAQVMSRFCPRCGSPLDPDAYICNTCHLDIKEYLSGADTMKSSVPMTPSGQQFVPATPPRTEMPPAFAEPQTPLYAPSFKSSRRQGMGGARISAIIVLALILLGSVGYTIYRVVVPGTGGGLGISLGGQAADTTDLHVTLTYAGVDITLLQVQRAQSFSDDSHAGSAGIVRLQVQAQNKTKTSVDLAYRAIAHLMLPSGKVIAPVYVTADPGSTVMPGTTQTGTIDFPISGNVKTAQLTLRLGADNEAQMDIPLTAQANVAKYAPKTTQLNKPVTYLGLNWTVGSATTQMSIEGKQAGHGMRYVILALKVDNPLAQTVVTGSPFDYLRLQAGTAVITPEDATVPVSLPAGATGKSGTVTFQAPQDVTALTLVFAPGDQDGFQATMVDFQVA